MFSFSRTIKEVESYAKRYKCEVDLKRFDFKLGDRWRKRAGAPAPVGDISELGHEVVSETTDGLPQGWRRVVSRASYSNGVKPLKISYVNPDGLRFW